MKRGLQEALISLVTVALAFAIGGLAVLIAGSEPVRRLQEPVGRRRLRLALPVHPGQPVRRRPAVRRDQPAADARQLHAARADRSRGRVRVPLRPLQHRRPGPVLGRRRVRARDRAARRRPPPRARARGHRSCGGRRGLGWHRGRAQGGARSARGHHHDHADLDRDLRHPVPVPGGRAVRRRLRGPADLVHARRTARATARSGASSRACTSGSSSPSAAWCCSGCC